MIALTLRCVIVDDNPAVLRAASELLEHQGMSVVGVAAVGDHAVALMEELEPDVMLVDIVLGRESGFELVRRLVQRCESAASRTILISTYEEADFAQPIAASPAVGFLPKSELSATAIQRLLAGARDEGPQR
ncbi:MAG TPA: response regulator transcription factor [Solirubrobacteraceae bacterium]|nr:response regulator transcription factor [Solirubrobacteraceae bacterium]